MPWTKDGGFTVDDSPIVLPSKEELEKKSKKELEKKSEKKS